MRSPFSETLTYSIRYRGVGTIYTYIGKRFFTLSEKKLTMLKIIDNSCCGKARLFGKRIRNVSKTWTCVAKTICVCLFSEANTNIDFMPVCIKECLAKPYISLGRPAVLIFSVLTTM